MQIFVPRGRPAELFHPKFGIRGAEAALRKLRYEQQGTCQIDVQATENEARSVTVAIASSNILRKNSVATRAEMCYITILLSRVRTEQEQLMSSFLYTSFTFPLEKKPYLVGRKLHYAVVQHGIDRM